MKQKEVFHEEWYSIPQETVKNLHEFIPRRLIAVLQANGDPTP
jgi:S-adenosylmethionine:tRNA-ribosyltransferase-isomerase (queuine synthetase)